jgi:hypothetical protein
MSNLKKYKRIPVLICFLFPLITVAQTNYRPGYVILSLNDTLVGKIDYRGDLFMGEICRFKKSDNIEEIIYRPTDILGYRFDEGRFFISRELNGKKVFLEYLLKGKVSIYYYRDSKEDHYYIEKDGVGLSEINYHEAIRYENETPYLVKSTAYIGLLSYYMQDAPEFRQRITNFGIPEHKSLIKLAKDYHNIMCKDTQCIVYEEKLQRKFLLEPYVGIGKIKLVDGFSKEFGINMSVWLPRVNENLYFKSGVMYGNVNSFQIFEVPLQLQYLHSYGRFIPNAGYGINLYMLSLAENLEDVPGMFFLPQINLGFHYKLNRKTFFSANLSSEYFPFFLTIYGANKIIMFSYSFQAGISIEL